MSAGAAQEIMTSRWLGLYLLTIAALTLFPFYSPACGSPGWTVTLLPGDSLMNALLFVPLGLALHRGSATRTAALALSLSLVIEFSQQWLPRSPDLSDLATNTIGALVGRALARVWHAHTPGPLMSHATEHFLIRLGAALMLVIALGESLLDPENDFSNWQLFPLVLGNETVGDRPWVGELYDLAIYDRALDRTTHGARSDDAEATARAPAAWADGGPILWLDFAGAPAGWLDGPSGKVPTLLEIHSAPSVVETEAALSFEPSGVELPKAVGEHLLERLRSTGELTVDARIRPESLQQRGPARILSFGQDGSVNLLLGQRRSSLVARVRTPGTSPDGFEPQIETSPGALSGETQRVSLAYDGDNARIWVDGVCVAESKLAISTSYALTGAALGGTIVLCCALAALAAASFARSSVQRVVIGFGAGAAAWSLLFAFGAWQRLEGFDATALTLGALSLATCVPMLLGRQPLTPRGPSAARDDAVGSWLRQR